MIRHKTREVRVGNFTIGGDAPIVVQSMLNLPPENIEANIAQARALEQAGCQIIRIAVPGRAGLDLIRPLKQAVNCPIVADIHFDYRLALAALEEGIDKIRINPGNIGSMDRVRQVALACKDHGVPIRIGVNGGSLEPEILHRYGGHPTPEAMVESARYHIGLLESLGFYDIVLSLKSSDVKTMLDAYRLAAQTFPYPLHLGVTEAGTPKIGLLKSAIGIGSLLADGIGDTIRVSLTADPAEEIPAAYDILKAAGRAQKGVTIVSCPTCGRTRIGLIELAKQVEEALRDCEKPIRVAVMGCIVNGPGEAREADIGIAGGNGEGVIFRHGEVLCKVPENQLVETLLRYIDEM